MLILTENDLALLDDIKQFLEALVPTLGNYNHPSNAHAHLRSVLFAPNQTLPIIDGSVELGTWQSLKIGETDVYPINRTVTVQLLGSM
jgi:secondary thiamine-phosphate synthase enzyme